MTLIMPPRQNQSKGEMPGWLDVSKISAASVKEVQERKNNMQKTASKVNTVVTHYGCSCGKRFSKDNPAFTQQITLAKNAGASSVDLTCPGCGSLVFPLDTLQQTSTNKDSRFSAEYADGNTDLTKKATYNTFVDRHVMFRAVEELQTYAMRNGMPMARARYIKSEHVKEAGFQYPILNNIEAEIEMRYGKNQKGYVTAVVSIDAAGTFKMPKVFKTADQKEHPFEKEYIVALMKDVSPKLMPPQRRKTDVPIFRQPDPSRFRTVASKNVESTPMTIGEFEDMKKQAASEDMQKEEGDAIRKYHKSRISFYEKKDMHGEDVEENALADTADKFGISEAEVKKICKKAGLNVDQPEEKQDADNPANTSPSEEAKDKLDSMSSKRLAGSYDDFMTSYGNEIREAIDKLKLISKAIKEGKISEEDLANTEGKLGMYDESAISSIFHWVYLDTYSIEPYLLAQTAIENMNRYGTEPRQLLYAIDDFARALNLEDLYEEEDEDEDLGIEGITSSRRINSRIASQQKTAFDEIIDEVANDYLAGNISDTLHNGEPESGISDVIGDSGAGALDVSM